VQRRRQFVQVRTWVLLRHLLVGGLFPLARHRCHARCLERLHPDLEEAPFPQFSHVLGHLFRQLLDLTHAGAPRVAVLRDAQV
jgi:hypothetical protein